MGVDPEVLLAHAEGLRALARSMLRDEHLAEDVVQDTMAAALHRRPSASRPLGAWLATVARNFARKRLRSEGRRRRREQIVARSDATDDTQVVVARFEEQRRVARAVAELDEPYRATVLLRYFEGLTAKEIAVRGGEPAATVRSRLKRARTMLRARLDEDRGGSAARHALLIAVAREGIGVSVKKKLLIVVGLVLLAAGVLMWRASRETGPIERRAEDERSVPGERGEAIAQERRAGPGASEPAFPETKTDAVRVRGRVRAARGTPISGATIRIGAATARTDEGGIFELGAALGNVRLVAEADGFMPLQRRLNPSRERQGLDVALHPARKVSGRVVNEDGQPVAGANIAVRFSTLRVRSGQDGLFTVPMDAGGFSSAQYDVTHRDYAPGRFFAHRTAFVAIVLRRGAPIEGRVVSVSGEPVPAATVLVLADVLHESRAGSDGRFRLDHVAAGRNEFTIVIRAPGHGQRLIPAVPFPPGRILDLRFAATRIVRGRVLLKNADGRRGLAGVVVKAMAHDGTADTLEGAPGPHAITDKDGRFEIRGASCIAGFVSVDTPGLVGTGAALPPGSATVDLELVVVQPVTVRVSVLDGRGRPVPGASCGAASAAGGFPRGGAARTGADGRAVFLVRSAANTPFVVAWRGSGARVSAPLIPGAGQVCDIELRLPPEETTTLRGRIRDRAGLPFVHIRVEAVARPSVGHAFTDADGRFSIGGLRPGPHRLNIRGPGITLFRKDGFISGTDIALVLPRGHEVRGRLVDESGTPVRYLSLAIVSREQEWNAQTDGDGRFVVLDVPAGEYGLRPGGDYDPNRDGEVNRGPAVVRVPGDPATFRVRRRPAGGMIRGRVLDANDQPFALGVRVTVRAARAKPPATRQASCNLNGDFVIRGLPPGVYQLLVRCGPLSFTGKTEVTAGPGEVLIRAPKTGSIEGVVHGPDGPVTAANVSAYAKGAAVGTDGFMSRQPAVRSAMTDAAGRFSLSFLPEGDYALVADSRRHAVAWTKKVPTGRHDAALRVAPGCVLCLRLLDPAGKPYSGTGRVIVVDRLGARRFAQFKGEKDIAVRALTPGSCTVQVWTNDGYFKSATAAVAGREEPTTLRLDKR